VAVDAQAIEHGLSTAQAIMTLLGGLGAWEGVKYAVGQVQAAYVRRRDAKTAALKAAEDAGAAKVEHSRDVRKDALAEVWQIAQERQEEIDRLTAQDERHRQECHDRLDRLAAQVTKLQGDNLECEKKYARLESRLQLLEKNGHA
jgi:predicted nuclease with TOPRIM domain